MIKLKKSNVLIVVGVTAGVLAIMSGVIIVLAISLKISKRSKKKYENFKI
jgi:hypothetical protein